jgi:branched-chain amino acid aminotransferase
MYRTYINGVWSEGNTPIFGAMDHSVWLGSSVFDGARSIRGLVPDLDLHLKRVISSAEKLGMQCPHTVAEMTALVKQGIALFPKDAELYIRPLVFATEGLLIPEVSKTGFALTLFDAAMPTAFTNPAAGFSACLSPLRRPDASMAPTDAKASSLYANSTRALKDAKTRGFDNAVMLDSAGHVTEFATSNIFFVSAEGKLTTPIANGTFLAGITRARVIKLLAEVNITVEERSVKPGELMMAKEIFNTGNYGKVTPCIRYESRQLLIGEIAKIAFERYMAFAAQHAIGDA